MNYFKRKPFGRAFDEDGAPVKLGLASIKSPKAPATPDPAAVSNAQTQSNIQTAAYNNAIEHGNTTTPLGSQTFTSRIDPTTGATVYDQTVSLSPEQQQLYDQQMQQDLALGNTAQKMLGSVDQAYAQPLDTSGMPELKGSLDTSGLPALYGADDLMGARQEVSDALYQAQAQYLDPQYSAREAALNTDLANKGVVEGSEAWRLARDQYARERQADYANARLAAIAGSGTEMSRLADIAQGNRSQMFGEGVTSGNFQNTARQQALSEALTKRALPLNEFNALRTASQVNLPQFQNPNNANAANTDVAGNVWNASNMDLQKWQTAADAQAQQIANFQKGLFGLGSSFIGSKS